MTRRILITAAATATLCLASCKPEESARQQAEVEAKFNDAAPFLERIQTDSRHVKRDNTSNDIGNYREEQLQLAAKALVGTPDSGQPPLAVARLLVTAESHSSQARMITSNAEGAWVAQGPGATNLITLASRIRLNVADAAQQAKIDYSKQLTDLQEREKQLKTEIEEINTGKATIAAAAKQLGDQVQELGASQKAKAAEADGLNRKAFSAKGQEQYDLYVKAGDAGRSADLITSKSDLAEASLDIEQSKLKIEDVRLAGATEQLAQVRDAITALNARIEQTKTNADAYKKTLDKLLNGESTPTGTKIELGFTATLDQYTQNQKSQIVDAFKKAADEYDQALKSAEEAVRVAPPEGGKALADLTAGAVLAQQGFLGRQLAVIHAGYAQQLKNIGESVTTALPDRATAIAALSADAEKQVTETKEQATKTLTTATDRLEKIATAAKTRDKAVERAAIQNMILAWSSLEAIGTGDGVTAAQTKVKELRDRLAALGQ